MADIILDLHLYGELAKYADEKTACGSANLKLSLKTKNKVRDVLDQLNIPTEKRGITFINGKLSAMPGLQPDLDYVLRDGDRLALFDLKSMWPFHYRHGAMMTEEMTQALATEKKSGFHHVYDEQT